MVTQPETGPACIVVCEWDVERLCRYGARGALALERLSRAEDGRIAWRMKRPLPDGTTHLLFTGLEFLRRVASLVPPPRANLTRFHGVFAPGAKVRPFQLPQAGAEERSVTRPQVGAEEASVAPEAGTRQERRKERTPPVDWAGLLRRTFAVDGLHLRQVWRQAAGAGVREASQRGARDFGASGTAHGRCEPDPGASATPGRLVLRLTPPQPRDLMPLPRPSWEGGLGRHAQGGCVASPPARLSARPAPVSGPPPPLCTSPPPPHRLYPAYTLPGRGVLRPGAEPERLRARSSRRAGDDRLPPLGDGPRHPQFAARADRRRALLRFFTAPP
ncbi:transposase [Archangium violaceum]|nr:transposase [Archangium violaceum]